MCDYSLAGIPNRLAVEGELLTVHRFQTGSKGFAARADLFGKEPIQRRTILSWLEGALDNLANFRQVAAVCIPPGARLMLSRIPVDLQDRWSVRAEAPAVFTQVSALENSHRDAIIFRNGRIVMLCELREGVLAQIEGLGPEETFEKREEQALEAVLY